MNIHFNVQFIVYFSNIKINHNYIQNTVSTHLNLPRNRAILNDDS